MCFSCPSPAHSSSQAGTANAAHAFGARGGVFAEALALAGGSKPGMGAGDEVSAACYIGLSLAGSLVQSINVPGWDGGEEDVMERVFNRTL